MPRSVLLRVRNISDKCCRENQNTHFMFGTFFFKNLVFYGINVQNFGAADRLQATWCMHFG